MNRTTTKPLISVVTVCLNAAESICRTLDSYRDQRDIDSELIVVDGGSTDATAEIIAQHTAPVEVLIQEPDSGIADAMNKGLAASRGQYILFLHADDYLIDTTALSRASSRFDGKTDILAFDLLYGSDAQLAAHHSRPFSHNCRFKTPFLHQATFCRRDLFEHIGNFDQAFKVCMDYDFFLRAYRAGASCLRVHENLTIMGDQGLSSRPDWPAVSARIEEEFRVQQKNRKSVLELLWYWPWWTLYPVYKKYRVTL